MTRDLTGDQAALVDTAVVEAVEESPGRILGIAEAKTIEADLEGYRTRLAQDAASTGVWLSRPRPGDLVDPDQGEPGTRRVSAKLPAADAVEANEMIDDVADALATHVDHDTDEGPPSRDELRVQAFTLLVTDPHAAGALLNGLDSPPSAEEPAPAPVKKKRALGDRLCPCHRPGPGRPPRRPHPGRGDRSDAARTGRRPGPAP